MARVQTSQGAKAPKKVPVALKAYLVAYNILSILGWGYILALTLIHIFNLDGKSDSIPSPTPKVTPSWISRQFGSSSSVGAALPVTLRPFYQRAATTYSRVGSQTTIVQSFAILEVVHALLGWVRSPVQTTAMQVASRLFLVWGVTEQFPEVRSNPFFTSMVFSWSFTEVIRYSFYAFNLVGMNPYPLLWLRYTTFYLLYPLGASSEAFVNFATLPSSIKTWQSTDYVRALLFAIWWPGLYIMYTYMIVQRRKVLGKPKTVKSE